MPGIIAIVGPTASGKSSLGLALAEALGGEIVNADALQVYRGFDIGTAKPTLDERLRVPHHLIDILDPGERYSAGEFARRARAAISEIAGRGRTAILVGGSGLYLRALWSGIAPLPPVNQVVRGELLGRLERDGLASLYSQLAVLDPATASRLGAGDTQRILRALEVALATGETLTSWIARQPFGSEPLSMRKIGLTLPRGLLYDAIAARVAAMVDAGWLDEVRALLARGVDRGSPAFQAIGYRDWLGFLDGEAGLEATQQKVVTLTRRFAKRQETWFRRETGVEWWDARASAACLMSLLQRPAVAGGEPEKIAGIAEPTGAPGGGG